MKTEETKYPKDFWTDDGQLYCHHGKYYGVNQYGRIICLRDEDAPVRSQNKQETALQGKVIHPTTPKQLKAKF